MKIIIVGAGLAGLAAAVCLAEDGHDVVVLERQEKLSQQGGLIGLRPSAVQVLLKHGLPDDAIDGANHVLGESQFCMLSNGHVVKNEDLHAHQVAGEGLTRLTTRPELARILFDAAKRAGVTIKLGVTVQDFDEDTNKVTLRFSNGSTDNADLVLVADGIRSRLRSKVLSNVDPSQCEPIITDTTFYVFNDVPAEDLPKNVRERMFDSNGPWVRMSGWLGKDSWGMSAFDRARNVVHFGLAIDEPTTQTGLWDEDGDVKYVQDFFETRACEEMREVIQAADHCDRWRLAYMPSLPRWTSVDPGSQGGRVALLGDAAHAILPNGGAGISMTIDDVGALSALIAREAGNAAANIPRILHVWQQVCKPRSERLREFAVFNMRCLHGDAVALAEREKGWKDETANGPNAVPDMHAQFSTMSFSKYLSGYDPVVAVDKWIAANE